MDDLAQIVAQGMPKMTSLQVFGRSTSSTSALSMAEGKWPSVAKAWSLS